MDQIEAWIKRVYAVVVPWADGVIRRSREHANRRTIVILIIGGLAATLLYVYAIQPPDNFPTGQLVTVPTGESAAQIGEVLQENGVVRSALAFRIAADILGHDRDLRAGDYLFKEPEDVFSIARAISIGAFGLEPLKIRIPEGATTMQMAQIFGTELQHFNQAAFLAQAQPLEGYLFPDTYFFLPNATESTVIEAMQQDFNTQIATIEPQIASSTHSLHDIVIMASIIEKEAQNDQDRRTIAGVLWHRISLGMDLQTDPTVTFADQIDNPAYNTYLTKGLPPGPIDSPSLDSILDAATPIKSNYLYYLADKNGVTHYSTTYAGHEEQIREYLN